MWSSWFSFGGVEHCRRGRSNNLWDMLIAEFALCSCGPSEKMLKNHRRLSLHCYWRRTAAEAGGPYVDGYPYSFLPLSYCKFFWVINLLTSDHHWCREVSSQSTPMRLSPFFPVRPCISYAAAVLHMELANCVADAWEILSTTQEKLWLPYSWDNYFPRLKESAK